MARFRGDNGKPDDTALKDLLSPYDADRSALTDCSKLAASAFGCRKAVLIYGFDYSDRSLDPVIEAFEVLAARLVVLGQREEARMGPLVHSVHATGHASITLTVDTYGKWLPSADTSAVDSLDDPS